MDIAHDLARRVFATISTKWGLLVLEAIGDDVRRFGELHRAVDGISYKMLTQTLRSLENDGLVTRRDFETKNPHVDYALTEAGVELVALIHEMCSWTRKHLDGLMVSRENAVSRVD